LQLLLASQTACNRRHLQQRGRGPDPGSSRLPDPASPLSCPPTSGTPEASPEQHHVLKSTTVRWLRESSPSFSSTNQTLLDGREKATCRGELNGNSALLYTAQASRDASENAAPAVCLGSVAAKLCQPTHTPGAQAEKQAETEGLIPFAFFISCIPQVLSRLSLPPVLIQTSLHTSSRGGYLQS